MRRTPRLPVTILAILVAVPLLLVPADFVLNRIYHPVAQKQLFGLMTTIKDDVRLDRRKTQVRWLLWILACAASASVLLLEVPRIRQDILAEGDPGGAADDTVVEKVAAASAVGAGGRYRLKGEIGRGSMGIIYSAVDVVLDRPVAVKALPSHFAADPARYERFRREALTLARLAHPGIVQVFDLVEDAGRHFFIMELVEGGAAVPASGPARRRSCPTPSGTSSSGNFSTS
ncbi:MAG: protein kinase [bacterium]|nr:MAG: protein kinase [bacterium]